ncbi:sialidase family protein [Paenibacillus cymbidii]|uniref:sialidase family protein n=1 Tax=Paenibacillus cymbidii TaxID=1639034 RepID=UPI001080C0BF|nr:sialidase family protein [Paenibacillus cymbidii]
MNTAAGSNEQQLSYSDEWKRTHPDVCVYLPQQPDGDDADNEHFLVFEAPYGGELLAMWTQGAAEGGTNQHIALARSGDGGTTWSAPQEIAGPRDDGHIASWGFPVVSRSGRIYCFCTKFTGVVDTHPAITGVLQCKYSDDNGHTWSDGGIVPFNRTNRDHPDPEVPPNFIFWQKPIRDARGRQIVGLTRHASKSVRKANTGIGWLDQETQCEFVRFDNIEEGPHPRDLRLVWLAQGDDGVRVPTPGGNGGSFAQEPSLVLLPDGRLFCVFRTLTGRIWYSVSADDGETWRQPEPLRYEDGGAEVLHPVSPGPVYALEDGRFLLLYHNTDGRTNGGAWPGDSNLNRHQAYIAVGEYRAEAHQPIWFSGPKLLCESGGVAIGASRNGEHNHGKPFRVEVATYTSLTEQSGRRMLWYPDRKHFLLGRHIADEWLTELKPPEGPSLYAPLVRKRTKGD